MERITVMYNLKPSVPFETFKDWSIEVDHRICNQQPEMKEFKVYRAIYPNGENVPFEIIQLAIVESLHAWESVTQQGEVKRVMDEWDEYADAELLVLLKLREVA